MKKGVFITNLSDFLKADIQRPFSILAKVEKFVLDNEDEIQEKFDAEDTLCILQRVQFYNGTKYYYVEIVHLQ
jgi:hypothetical protein